jgi:hypothetical protein
LTKRFTSLNWNVVVMLLVAGLLGVVAVLTYMIGLRWQGPIVCQADFDSGPTIRFIPG